MKMKYMVFRLFSVLAALGLVFLAGEVGLRAAYQLDQARGGDLQQRLKRSARRSLDQAGGEFNMSGLVQSSPFTGIVYELKPNLVGTFRGKILRSNSQGLRDQEYPVEKPPHTFRIAGLGDSVMFGWGVHQGEAYLDVLEDRLHAMPGDPPRFEVLNFALPGYNTAMEVAVYEHKAQKFSPDLVIIQFINNDFGAPIFMQRQRSALTPRRSYALDFLRTRLGWIQRGLDDDLVASGHVRHLERDEAVEVLDQYRYMIGERGYRQAMSRLAELTGRQNIPVILIRGTSSEAQQAIVEDVAREHGFHIVEIAPYTRRFIREQGIEDTREARQKALWVSPGDHHPNARAHPIYADALIDKLIELNVIPPPPDWAPLAPEAGADEDELSLDS
jgi:lysophospholipase L1-like esterase